MRIISGTLGGRRISVPKSFSARPTTDIAREALFNILSNRIDFEDLAVLDLFSGTGSVSMEFYSRGVTTLTSVEMSAVYASFIKKNMQELGITGTKIVCANVFKFLPKARAASYDLIFADPPFDLDGRTEIVNLVFEHNLLKPDGLLIVEHSPNDNYHESPFFMEVRHYGKVNFSFFKKN
ncbi:MAG: 16S rRNA (guanine(966)-N(2))-methyltransferase RsmD [Salinivirgaceae bacterium]|nr:16S rRNA (guanine(966)-N(2))-methyltransferase RsmD [Salinivirgaceae bacterium]MDD4747954.1 16S rRNA (guanine(966)-N(2))-methyltransferase RsmD [Salinivirgaceae bacterium]MDY0280948.1 16S rRNA (guanine(966)-N(2))-methyltransferase RsmD [Salinivirgaceae bacterium]